MQRGKEGLEQQIERMIVRAEFRPGERMGSERMLAERFDVARSALREALDSLEERGRIRRNMGRAGGIYVGDGKIDRNLNTIQSIPHMLRQQGYRSSTTVLRSELGLAAPSERRNLRLVEGEYVLRLQRRRDADGEPLSLDTMSLPATLLPNIQRHDFSASVYDILSKEYDIELAHADETIDVSSATADEAAVLRVEVGAPLISIWRVSVDTLGRPIEFAHDMFRADRTRISMKRHGSRWKHASSKHANQESGYAGG
ncbi:GntR family transcriptional regulator [Microbacterium sp. ZW T5_45]|uniref:GntR family transcriptional regulator n=1 Tax=Microbacterium sp. ZW T5_45 TaxID=3378080 RepID=UPI003854A55D